MAFEFTIAGFPLINLNDLIIVSDILGNMGASKVTKENKHAFILGCAHIKAFLECYFDYLAISDIDQSILTSQMVAL